MYQSPVGRIHQASRRMNNPIEQLANPMSIQDNAPVNHIQNAPPRRSLSFDNPQQGQNLDRTMNTEPDGEEPPQINVIEPTQFSIDPPRPQQQQPEKSRRSINIFNRQMPNDNVRRQNSYWNGANLPSNRFQNNQNIQQNRFVPLANNFRVENPSRHMNARGNNRLSVIEEQPEFIFPKVPIKLIRNSQNKLVPPSWVMEVQNVRPSRQIENTLAENNRQNSSGFTNNFLNNNNSNNHSNNFSNQNNNLTNINNNSNNNNVINNPNDSPQSHKKLLSKKLNNNNSQVIVVNVQQINQKLDRKTSNQFAKKNPIKSYVLPKLRPQQITQKQFENRVAHQHQLNHNAYTATQNKKQILQLKFEKNEEFNKHNVHNIRRQNKTFIPRQVQYDHDLPIWLQNQTLFIKPYYPLLQQPPKREIPKLFGLTTKDQEFQKHIPPNLYNMYQQCIEINKYLSIFYKQKDLKHRVNPQQQQFENKIAEGIVQNQIRFSNMFSGNQHLRQTTPFELLKIKHQYHNQNQSTEQNLTLPKTPIKTQQKQKQIDIYQLLYEKRRHKNKLQEYINKKEEQQQQKQRKKKVKYQQLIKQQNKKYDKFISNHNRSTNCIPNYAKQYQANIKNQSTDDKTTTSKKLPNSKNQQQLPKVSQFEILPYDKPYNKKYNITIENYECHKYIWQWKKWRLGLKTNYQGEVHFEKYSSQLSVNDVLIRDIFSKQAKILQLFKNSKKVIQKHGLRTWFSSRFDSQLVGVFILPLQLKLPQGYDYFYNYYSGDRISDLVIFNKFAQLSFLEDIKIEGKSQKARDWRNNIRFDNNGIWIGCQMLKTKCKFIYWGNEQKMQQFANIELLTQKQISKKIIPMNEGSEVYNILFDASIPTRIQGEISWNKSKTKRCMKCLNFAVLCLSLLMMILFIIIAL